MVFVMKSLQRLFSPFYVEKFKELEKTLKELDLEIDQEKDLNIVAIGLRAIVAKEPLSEEIQSGLRKKIETLKSIYQSAEVEEEKERFLEIFQERVLGKAVALEATQAFSEGDKKKAMEDSKARETKKQIIEQLSSLPLGSQVCILEMTASFLKGNVEDAKKEAFILTIIQTAQKYRKAGLAVEDLQTLASLFISVDPYIPSIRNLENARELFLSMGFAVEALSSVELTGSDVIDRMKHLTELARSIATTSKESAQSLKFLAQASAYLVNTPVDVKDLVNIVDRLNPRFSIEDCLILLERMAHEVKEIAEKTLETKEALLAWGNRFIHFMELFVGEEGHFSNENISMLIEISNELMDVDVSLSFWSRLISFLQEKKYNISLIYCFQKLTPYLVRASRCLEEAELSWEDFDLIDLQDFDCETLQEVGSCLVSFAEGLRFLREGGLPKDDKLKTEAWVLSRGMKGRGFKSKDQMAFFAGSAKALNTFPQLRKHAVDLVELIGSLAEMNRMQLDKVRIERLIDQACKILLAPKLKKGTEFGSLLKALDPMISKGISEPAVAFLIDYLLEIKEKEIEDVAQELDALFSSWGLYEQKMEVRGEIIPKISYSLLSLLKNGVQVSDLSFLIHPLLKQDTNIFQKVFILELVAESGKWLAERGCSGKKWKAGMDVFIQQAGFIEFFSFPHFVNKKDLIKTVFRLMDSKSAVKPLELMEHVTRLFGSQVSLDAKLYMTSQIALQPDIVSSLEEARAFAQDWGYDDLDPKEQEQVLYELGSLIEHLSGTGVDLLELEQVEERLFGSQMEILQKREILQELASTFQSLFNAGFTGKDLRIALDELARATEGFVIIEEKIEAMKIFAISLKELSQSKMAKELLFKTLEKAVQEADFLIEENPSLNKVELVYQLMSATKNLFQREIPGESLEEVVFLAKKCAKENKGFSSIEKWIESFSVCSHLLSGSGFSLNELLDLDRGLIVLKKKDPEKFIEHLASHLTKIPKVFKEVEKKKNLIKLAEFALGNEIYFSKSKMMSQCAPVAQRIDEALSQTKISFEKLEELARLYVPLESSSRERLSFIKQLALAARALSASDLSIEKLMENMKTQIKVSMNGQDLGTLVLYIAEQVQIGLDPDSLIESLNKLLCVCRLDAIWSSKDEKSELICLISLILKHREGTKTSVKDLADLMSRLITNRWESAKLSYFLNCISCALEKLAGINYSMQELVRDIPFVLDESLALDLKGVFIERAAKEAKSIVGDKALQPSSIDFRNQILLAILQTSHKGYPWTVMAEKILDYQYELGLKDTDPLLLAAARKIVEAPTVETDANHYIWAQNKLEKEAYPIPKTLKEVNISLKDPEGGTLLLDVNVENIERVMKQAKPPITYGELKSKLEEYNQKRPKGSILLDEKVFKHLCNHLLAHLQRQKAVHLSFQKELNEIKSQILALASKEDLLSKIQTIKESFKILQEDLDEKISRASEEAKLDLMYLKQILKDSEKTLDYLSTLNRADDELYLKERLKHLAEAVDPESDLNKKIKLVEGIHKDFTHPSKYVVKGLLAKTFKEDESEVPVHLEMLYEIAENILNISSKQEPYALLTPQEEKVISHLLPITECETGQGQGIELCHESMRLEKERLLGVNRKEKTLFAEGQTTSLFLKQMVVQEVRKEFFKPEMTWDRLGIRDEGSKKQGVHQNKYVKSMVGEDLIPGYRDDMDVHGECISPDLRAKDRKTILKAFFAQVTENLVKAIQREVQEQVISQDHKLINDMSYFLTRHGIDLAKAFILGATDNLALTEYGVLALLKIEGYLEGDLAVYENYLSCKEKLDELDLPFSTQEELESRISEVRASFSIKNRRSQEKDREKEDLERLKELERLEEGKRLMQELAFLKEDLS